MDNIKAGTLETLELLVERLDLIERTQEATRKSRLNAGILFIPEGITEVSRDPEDARYGLPCIVVGGHTIYGEKDLLDQVKLIDFHREDDPKIQAVADRTRAQIKELTEFIQTW